MTTRQYAITVVKQLREITSTWDSGYRPEAARAMVVKDLVERLPSFRNSPQTRTENSLRAIEAVLASKIGDMTKRRVETVLPITDCEARDLVVAIATVVNVHHGILFDPDFSVKEATTKKAVVFTSAPTLEQKKDFVKALGDSLDAQAKDVEKAALSKAIFSNVTNDPAGDGDF